jgi:hypothetical protein
VVQPTVQSGVIVVDALTISLSGPKPQASKTQSDEEPVKYINSQELNRYSYVLNNPLKYSDPSGSSAWLAELVSAIPALAILIDIPLLGLIVAAAVFTFILVNIINDRINAANADKSNPDDVIQVGKNKIDNRTAKALNKYKGKNLNKRDLGRALEKLKKDSGVSNKDHGVITRDGSYYSEKGEYIGNIWDYVN